MRQAAEVRGWRGRRPCCSVGAHGWELHGRTGLAVEVGGLRHHHRPERAPYVPACLPAPTQSSRRRALLRDWGWEHDDEDEDEGEGEGEGRGDGASPAQATAIAGTASSGCRVTSSKGLRYFRNCVQLTVSSQRVQLAYTISRVAGRRAVLSGALLLPAVPADTWAALGTNPGARQQMAGTSAILTYPDKSAAGTEARHSREGVTQHDLLTACTCRPNLGAATEPPSCWYPPYSQGPLFMITIWPALAGPPSPPRQTSSSTGAARCRPPKWAPIW